MPDMQQKKILVPIRACGGDLKSVHYALALAERVQAQIYILQESAALCSENPLSTWVGEALCDLINSARLAGLLVSHYIAHKELKEEIIGLVKDEGIDLLVFSKDDDMSDRLLMQIKALVPSQIIRVSEKNCVDYIKGERGTQWQL
jgi:hypothetical protein